MMATRSILECAHPLRPLLAGLAIIGCAVAGQAIAQSAEGTAQSATTRMLQLVPQAASSPVPSPGPGQGEQALKNLPAGAGALHMKELLKALQEGKTDSLPAAEARAVDSAQKSAEGTMEQYAKAEHEKQFSEQASKNWLLQAQDAFVAALPPRDQALGRSIIQGDGTIPGSTGQVYVFVSRSMPMSLLRAYALDAMYSGAILVTKGIRRGETVKDYVQEMLDDYNSADGQVLATQEINPNLFDMFDVKVVPTVVWTARAGLEDVGSGCEAPAPIARPRMTLDGPSGTKIEVEKPTCLPAPGSSYYKLAGALKMDYVLERFVKAGAPKAVLDTYREHTKAAAQNVFQGASDVPLGNAMPRIADDIHVDALPKRLLKSWQEDLKHFKVRRGPYGPAFGEDGEDDPAYRELLEKRIRHGLGLS